MTPEQIIATVIALLAAEPDPALDPLRNGGFDNRYPVTVESCPRPLPPLEIEGRTVICGRVEVPVNHDAPDGSTIPLAFAILRTPSQSPAPDPVIYLHGGPGGYTVQDIPTQNAIFGFLRNRRDIVIFDQRAAGISDSTLACLDTQSASIIEFTKKEDLFAAGGALEHCIREVQAAHADLRYYNTTQNAKDVRAIMYALGYPTYNAFGVSYGTKLGQELLRAAPEGLRSLVIDSISRVDNPAYSTNGVPVDQALGWMIDFCAADPKCAAAYPDLETTINEVGATLKETPIKEPGVWGEELGWDIVPGLAEKSNGVAGTVTAFLPLVFTDLHKGDTASLTKLLSGGFNPPALDPATIAAGKQGLAPHDKAIAEVLAMQAGQLQGLEASVNKLLATLAGDVSPGGQAVTERLLDDEITAIAGHMEVDSLVAMAQDYVKFVGASPDRAAIERFLKQHIPPAELPPVLGLLAAMSDADVAAFYARSAIDAARVTTTARMLFGLAIYACQEDFPYNSLEKYDEAVKGYRFPAVAAQAEDDKGIFPFCDLFEKFPRDGFHDPVVSDLPVLAMSGTKDTQTNSDAAEKVVRTLPNGFAFTFPEAGHAVIQFSACARDIVIAFLEDPETRPNDACIETLKPDYYVPEQ